MTDSRRPWHLAIVRCLSSLVLYPVLWFMEWQNRRLKRKLARLPDRREGRGNRAGDPGQDN